MPAGRAGPDEALEVPIDDGVPERAAAQVDPADRIALRAVTGDALRRVQRRPVGDIRVGILAVVQRGLGLRPGGSQADRPQHHRQHHGRRASTHGSPSLSAASRLSPCRHYPPMLAGVSITPFDRQRTAAADAERGWLRVSTRAPSGTSVSVSPREDQPSRTISRIHRCAPRQPVFSVLSGTIVPRFVGRLRQKSRPRKVRGTVLNGYRGRGRPQLKPTRSSASAKSCRAVARRGLDRSHDPLRDVVGLRRRDAREADSDSRSPAWSQ